MGGGDIIPKSILESTFEEVSANVDSFLDSIVHDNQNKQNIGAEEHYDYDDDDDDDDDARTQLPAGAGSPLALALAATDAIVQPQSPPIEQKDLERNVLPDDSNDIGGKNLMSALNESTNTTQDAATTASKKIDMADILGGNDIAQLLLQEHYKAEEVLRQMESDRIASEKLAESLNNDDSVEHAIATHKEEVEEEETRDRWKSSESIAPSSIPQTISGTDEPGQNEKNTIDFSQKESQKELEELYVNEPSIENMKTDSLESSSDDISNMEKKKKNIEKKKTMERGEIIIDFVWENEIRGRWLSVLAVRAGGGGRDDSNCWVKPNEKDRRWFESPRQVLVDSFTENNGPFGDIVYRDESEQLRKSRSNSVESCDRKNSFELEVEKFKKNHTQSEEEVVEKEQEELMYENGNYWTWLSPWQVDNSDTFGIDRLDAQKQTVISELTGEAPDWLYADAWPVRDVNGEELGYYAESKGSLWTKARCRRWVRPRERVVFPDKPAIVNESNVAAVSEQPNTLVNSNEGEDKFPEVEDGNEGSTMRMSAGGEAAGVRCKVCGMVLPMDTDEVEYHMEQGCGGGGDIGNERSRIGLRNRIRGLSFFSSSTKDSLTAPPSSLIENDDDDGKVANNATNSTEQAPNRFSFFQSSKTKKCPSSPSSISSSSSAISQQVQISSENKMDSTEVDFAALLLEEHKKAEKLLSQMAANREDGEESEVEVGSVKPAILTED